MSIATIERQGSTNTSTATKGPAVAAFERYLDTHNAGDGVGRTLHTLVGLTSIDHDLLQSSVNPETLVARREEVYTLACERLAGSPQGEIAAAIDHITDALSAQDDSTLSEVLATLAAIRPNIPRPTSKTGKATIQDSINPNRPFTPEIPKRIIRGLVVTAAAMSLAVGVAPKAAADVTDNTNDGKVSGADASTQTTTGEQSTVTTAGNQEVPTDAAPALPAEEPTPSVSTESTPAPSLEEGLSNIFGEAPVNPSVTPSTEPATPSSTSSAPKTADSSQANEQAASELTHALNTGNQEKIQQTADSIQRRIGEIGFLFTLLDTVDNPRADTQQDPTKEKPSEPGQHSDKNKNQGDKPGNDKKAPGGEKQATLKYDKLLNLIASFESGGNYNAYFGHATNHQIKFTSMTLGEVIAWQHQYVKDGSPSSATGKYQFLVGTLETLATNYGSISKNQIFNKGLQDKLAIILLKQRGLDRYLKDEISAEEFAHNLSKEWASFPSVTGDHPDASYYDGDGLNKAHVKVATLLNAIRSMKNAPSSSGKDKARGIKGNNGQADDNGACPSGTDLVKGITVGWTRSGKEEKITLCAIPGTRVINSTATPHWKDKRYNGTTAAGETRIAVNADIAKDTLRMARAARKAGIVLQATIGYRSLAEQCSIVDKNHPLPSVCPDWVTPVPGNWSSNTVYSNHMLGYSFDGTEAVRKWMEQHGAKYGYKNDVWIREGWDRLHFTHVG